MNTHKDHDLKGERKNQILILTDKQGHLIGEATREECHRGDGKTHLAFMAFVIDREGKIILTKRSRQKSLWPLYWDASIVSHVLNGETPECAAHRRGKEELGIDISFIDKGAFLYQERYKDQSENEYCHILVGTSEQNPFPNAVEIEDMASMCGHELDQWAQNQPHVFTPWFLIAWKKFRNKILLGIDP